MAFNPRIKFNDENVRPRHPNIINNTNNTTTPVLKPSATKTSMISKKMMISNQEITRSSPPISTKSNQLKDDELRKLIMNEVNEITSNPEIIEKIEINLKETNKELPKISLFQHGDNVILYRGCKPSQLASMLVSGTAGGLSENPNPVKPSEEAALDQVGERKSLPEFTTSLGVTQSFGKGNIMTAFSMKKSHLKQGSVVESGMVCNPDTPIKLTAWREGLPFEEKEKETI